MSSKNVQLQNRLADLPDFVFDFTRKYYDGESINTQIAYAIDIKTYLTFLMTREEFKDKKQMDQFTPKDLEGVSLNTLLDYKIYLESYPITYQVRGGDTRTVWVSNGQKGMVRKLSTLRTLYSFLFTSDLISKNITEKLQLPRISFRMKKPLSAQDTLRMIDVIYFGERHFENRHLSGYIKRKKRDIAIFTTILGTGIRVSELAGLDIDHLDFENNSFIVTRKGGDHQEIYMPIQVRDSILEYLEERSHYENVVDKNALFLSNRGTRMTISAIEKMIKKYGQTAGITSKDKLTVHALRRTFACDLLADGVDLKMVAELMGHADISVTDKYYAQHNKAAHRAVMSKRKIPVSN